MMPDSAADQVGGEVAAARYPGGPKDKGRDPKGGTPAAQSVLEDATGGLDGAVGGVAGDVPVRTDDAVGASQQVRANARMVAPISARTRVEARQIIARYPRSRSALLPMLHLVQSEQGYVTRDGVAMCAEELGLTKAEVGAVATFYTMFKRRPTGEYLISVCTNTLCGFLGGEEIYATLSQYLDVGHDQTTADGLITLEHAECLAACDYAPVVTVNYEFYDQQDTESALNLVKDLQRGERPHPTRGAPLSSFLEISRELAGFVDPATEREAVDGPSAGVPTLAGIREALRRGDESPAFDADTSITPAPPKEEPPTKPSPEPEPQPEPESVADPEPAPDAEPEKAFSEQAEREADNEAEAAGARAADPDAEEQAREPGNTPDDAPDDTEQGSTPSARRTRRRTRKD